MLFTFQYKNIPIYDIQDSLKWRPYDSMQHVGLSLSTAVHADSYDVIFGNPLYFLSLHWRKNR